MDDSFKTIREENSGNLETIRKTVGEELDQKLKSEFKLISETQNQNLGKMSESQNQTLNKMSESQNQNLNKMSDSQNQSLNKMSEELKNSLLLFEQRLKGLEDSNKKDQEQMRQEMQRQLTNIREDNSKRLESIQNTVNEKLDQRLNDSFKQVSERLEQVYKGLGEMQTIASGVGDLKKVLSNVKTRGIMGEIQLGAILSEILAPEQYETNVEIVPGSKKVVEFAVKLPGTTEGDKPVYLPIDSKFPGERYSALQDAYESGSPEAVSEAKKALVTEIKLCAKDISTKYICPPYSTNFAIMFLPFEGLYAEVVNSGLVDELQRTFSVNVAGPSTMAALLNSLQMGFRTLALQKRSTEVWNVLGAVKTEFGTFKAALEKAQKQIQTAESSLNTLVGTRMNVMSRKLKDVEALPADTAAKVLGTDALTLIDTSDDED
ncbi:MAG: DNA recombination protein RmuC [Ruminococcus sp.]|nr:DNA recombination protein RmuC [Ruminococcus sp.]